MGRQGVNSSVSFEGGTDPPFPVGGDRDDHPKLRILLAKPATFGKCKKDMRETGAMWSLI